MAEHKHAEVLRAIADGKEVQYKNCYGKWYDAEFNPFTPLVDIDIEWRVKPEPKLDYYRYICFDCTYAGSTTTSLRLAVPCDWKNKIKITFDGETNEPKYVELIK